jgi:hypothetical protein
MVACDCGQYREGIVIDSESKLGIENVEIFKALDLNKYFTVMQVAITNGVEFQVDYPQNAQSRSFISFIRNTTLYFHRGIRLL